MTGLPPPRFDTFRTQLRSDDIQLINRIRAMIGTGMRSPGTSWTFAASVESAVTRDECEALAEYATDRAVLEFGSFLGRSTIAMGSVARVVHAVDPHIGCPPGTPETLERFLENLQAFGVRDRVVVHVATSNDVANILRPKSFDAVFIDAMHQRPDIDFDISVAARAVVPGGVIAFHDYGLDGVQVNELWHPFGVTEAVDEFVEHMRLDEPVVVDHLAIVRAPSDTNQGRRASWDVSLEHLPLTGATPQPYRRTQLSLDGDPTRATA